jgi:hypothetical protein
LGLTDAHMTFRTIYEATPPEKLLLGFPVIGLAGVLMGILMVIKPHLYLDFVFPWARGISRKALGWMWLVFFCIWTITTFPSAINWRTIAQNEPFDVAEGRVTDFVHMPYNGPSHGSFVVSGKQFRFSEFDREPIPVENWLKDGVYARVTFRERPINRIYVLRIEVADPN